MMYRQITEECKGIQWYVDGADGAKVDSKSGIPRMKRRNRSTQENNTETYRGIKREDIGSIKNRVNISSK